MPIEPWWKGAAIYQIYPASFADSNGDGFGDLAGIESRLDHVAGLGVDAVWLSPFFASPMRDWGYDVSDHCSVDPRFGTLEDFNALVERAHRLGLKVIIDQVYSHTSDRHSWFQDSRAGRAGARADWYVWSDPKDDGAPPNNWQSVFGGPAWTWDSRRGQYYLHNFLAEQPDLNVRNPAVQDALLDVARFWLDRGVDGFRLDAINFAMHDPQLRDNPPAADRRNARRPFDFQQHLYNQSQPDVVAFFERLRKLTDSRGGRFTLAEVVGEDALAEMRDFTAPGRLDSAYGFDFLYAERLTPQLVAQVSNNWPEDAGWPTWAFENHDSRRAISRWAVESHRDRFLRMKMLLLCTLRGSIILYQGEELGLPQAQIPFEQLRDPEAIANWPDTLGRDGARTPMPWTAAEPNAGFSTADPWLPAPDGQRDLAVDVQQSSAESMLAFTRSCLELRRSVPALRTGAMRILEATGQFVRFEREADGRRILCSFNLSAAPVPFERVGEPLIEAGEVGESVLGPFSAVVEVTPTLANVLTGDGR